MTCSVYKVDLIVEKRYPVANLGKHTDMNQWLRTNGDVDYIYEVWKIRGIHSRWHWKDKEKKWGRMSTPRNKTMKGTT